MFRSGSMLSGAAPARAAVLGKCDSASVSATVASHAKHLPEAHGIMVTPSGLLPSLDINSLGSMTEGTSQLAKARSAYRVEPAPLVHQRATAACVRPADLAAQAETNRNAE